MGVTSGNLNAERYIESLALAVGMSRDDLRIEAGGSLNVNAVELALTAGGHISEVKMLALKQRSSGLKVTDSQAVQPVGVLPPAVAKAAGAIALDGPTPTIGFVEDLDVNVETVQVELGLRSFEVWLMTASQFSNWWRMLYADPSKEARPAAQTLAELFDAALETEATDIHLSTGLAPARGRVLLHPRGRGRHPESRDRSYAAPGHPGHGLHSAINAASDLQLVRTDVGGSLDPCPGRVERRRHGHGDPARKGCEVFRARHRPGKEPV